MTDTSGSHRTVAHAAAPCDNPEENLAMHMVRKLDAFEWTLAELHRLPDDGNKYELVRGELFVTPAPRPAHERLAVVLSDMLSDYVRRERIGRVFRPRSVVRFQGSEVEPDIMVCPWSERPVGWDDAPVPLLVVEILSDVTRHRDRGPKRELYVDAGVAEYWIVDGETRTITVIRREREDMMALDTLTWHPVGAAEPLAVDVQAIFREALGT
jgi:Uma2 family endonuclease